MIRLGGKRRLWLICIGIALVVAGTAVLLNHAGARLGLAGNGASSGLWEERSEAASGELERSFWDGKRQMFNNASPCLLQLCTDPFNYWWQAHAADTLLDIYARSKDEAVKKMIGELFDGILNRNAGMWPNDYYDDMEWMALAWLRAYELLGDEKYKEASLILWKEIRTGWNEQYGGGIAWRKEQSDYKNTPANAPAVILAARLYRNFDNEEDLVWAKRIYEWHKSTLVDPASGLVWDGINRTGDGTIDSDWKFTYGQGVFIGAAIELYRIGGEEKYLADARRTANNVIDSMASPATGLLPNEGDGDGALFKGILIRYLTELVEEDKSRSGPIEELIYTNAESLWDYGRTGDKARFGPSWAQPPEALVQLSSQISGTMLLEQAAALEKFGFKSITK
ncbi:glycoside hydrolase family 76 protein [Cohnella endophytica]|uniref:glycoside hydrolase family 76 protein n=1 Tax=Cohnella endophytica TaxID=2419778 RepID=UPI0018F3F0BD|nr:glycoside hydrolase family 76 protein [Cohnella endophytica]